MRTAWGVTDGSAGMTAQVRALGVALGVQPLMKRITVKKPWGWLPNAMYPGLLQQLIVPNFIEYGSDPITMPWPDMVISCGRRSAIAAMGMRVYMQSPTTNFIHIQDPHVHPKHFDVVVAMEHDDIEGDNVIKSKFALHTITPALLEEARARFASRFGGYAKPLTAVLLGGSTNKYQLTETAMVHVIVALQELLKNTQGSLLITPSRRTGKENIAMLKQSFAGNGRVYIYDFVGENPYMGLLALADAIIVTNDSVNMMSEAYATGKPIYLLPLPGHADTKPANFGEKLQRYGAARLLGGKLESWNYRVDNEMGRLAAEIKTRLTVS